MADTLKKLGILVSLIVGSTSLTACPDTAWLNSVDGCKVDEDCNPGLKCCGTECKVECSSVDISVPADVSDASLPDTQVVSEECTPLGPFQAAGNRSYRVCTAPKTHQEAVSVCEGYGESALFLPETKAERNRVFGLMQVNDEIDESAMTKMWLGISAGDAIGLNQTEGGSITAPIPFSWNENEPSVGKGECVRLELKSAGNAKNWEWSVEPCSDDERRFPFICESTTPYDACEESKLGRANLDALNPCGAEENCQQVEFGDNEVGYQCCEKPTEWNEDEKACGLTLQDPCADNPCGSQGTCIVAEEGSTYTCDCSPGYTDDGTTCAEATDCGQNGEHGDFLCGVNGVCINLEDGSGYTCECDDGFVKYGEEPNSECISEDQCLPEDIAACSDYDGCIKVDGKTVCICPVGKLLPNGVCDCPSGTEETLNDAGMECNEILPLDCDGVLEQNVPGSPSGYYKIDPDGDGGASPIMAWCDLIDSDGDGEGWTQIAFNNGSQMFDKDVYLDGTTPGGKGAPINGDNILDYSYQTYALACGLWEKWAKEDDTRLVARVTMRGKADGDIVYSKTEIVDYFSPSIDGATLCSMLISAEEHIWWWNGFAYNDGSPQQADDPEWIQPGYVTADLGEDTQDTGLGGSKQGDVIDLTGRLYLNFWGSTDKTDKQKGGCCTNSPLPNEELTWGLPFDIAIKRFPVKTFQTGPIE